jgi:4-amino-4-deoxy-L-arabinose transferase-like glycosyltransferase
VARPARLLGAGYPAAVALVKIAACAAVLASGFRAVSDDDFARVVIAEQWGRSPRWDASGTSWLPLPFWIVGASMMALGRGLFAARAAAMVLGIASALLVYVAARWLGEERPRAAAGAAIAAVFPWSARLGVATVPELMTAALTLLGVAAIASPKNMTQRSKRLLAGGAALAMASLSRYEAWPVAAAFALLTAIEAARTRRATPAIAASIAALGPASWVVWNRVAHGDALHFLARVAAYKHALGGAESSAASRLFAYPLALAREEPEIVALLLAGAALVALREGRAALGDALGGYALPAGMIAIQIAALSLAMIKDGAPTHHPERAVLTAMLLIALAAGSLSVRALARSPRVAHAFALAGAIALALVAVRARAPREPFAARADEEGAGRAVARAAKPGDRVLVEVADYGYLAVTAALGRPEDVVRDRSVDPRDARQPSSFEDREAIRRRVAESGARWVVARKRAPVREALGEPVTTHGAWAVFRRGAE